MKRFGVNLIVLGSILWIVSLFISPIYITTTFGILIFFIFSKKINLNILFLERHKTILFYIFYLLSTQFFLNAKISPLTNQIFSLIYFILIFETLKKSTNKLIINSSYSLIYFSIPILIFESFYRFANPIFETANNVDYRDTDSPFYAYKLNSVLNQDSNYVSVLILVLFFFSLYISTKRAKYFPYLQIILSFLLFLTISRASILIYIFSLIYIFFQKLLKSPFIKILLSLLVVYLLYEFYLFILEDLSTQIKFASFLKTADQLYNSSILNKLFGIGIGNSAEILGGVSAHNIIEALILEQGFLGLILFFLVQFKIDKISCKKTRIVMIPFLFVSMSFFVYAITYYYAILAIIVLIENKSYAQK